VNALKDGKIDAFFWNGGLPTAAVTDLAATPNVKMHLVDHAEVVEPMNKKYGQLYVKGTIPAKTYPGQETPNQIATAWTLLVVSEKMPDQLAYNIVKTVFEHKPELVNVHKEAQNFELANQAKTASPVPYHPGAAKYYAEKGVNVR
jgi:TRAP transporter TAXI family solute receptor